MRSRGMTGVARVTAVTAVASSLDAVVASESSSSPWSEPQEATSASLLYFSITMPSRITFILLHFLLVLPSCATDCEGDDTNSQQKLVINWASLMIVPACEFSIQSRAPSTWVWHLWTASSVRAFKSAALAGVVPANFALHHEHHCPFDGAAEVDAPASQVLALPAFALAVAFLTLPFDSPFPERCWA